MRAKKSFRQNLKKVFIMDTSELAALLVNQEVSKCRIPATEIPKTKGAREPALNWDASVYFLNCYLRNTGKAMTSHRWYGSGKQQDKETFWKRAEYRVLHDSRRAWSMCLHCAGLTLKKEIH